MASSYITIQAESWHQIMPNVAAAKIKVRTFCIKCRHKYVQTCLPDTHEDCIKARTFCIKCRHKYVQTCLPDTHEDFIKVRTFCIKCRHKYVQTCLPFFIHKWKRKVYTSLFRCSLSKQ